MNLASILLIGFSLSFDAFAVSVSDGVKNKTFKPKRMFLLGIVFGLFQGIMPIIGYFASLSIKNYVEKWDHWLAFFILMALGSKFIYESLFNKKEENIIVPPNFYLLFSLGLATSIDALVVGITMPFFSTTFLFPSFMIGLITFLMSMIGVKLGNKYGSRFNLNCELIGGLILCGIGTKILLEHLVK